MPDPTLRRYFEQVYGSPAFVLGLSLHYREEIDIPEEVRIADYLPHRPLLSLEVQHHHYCEDRTRPVVLPLATVRGELVDSLLAVVSADVGCASRAAADPDRRALIVRAALLGTTPIFDDVVAPGDFDIFGRAATEAAWRRVFGEEESVLRWRFAVKHKALHSADDGPPRRRWREEWVLKHRRQPKTREEEIAIDREHGVEPWHTRPYHFLNWAWSHHRRLGFADFAAYGLDDTHWQVLMAEDPATARA